MAKTVEIHTPIDASLLGQLDVRDTILLTGSILTGRDAALPRLVAMANKHELSSYGVDLQGSAIFHSAVSGAGMGPTSSNKEGIEQTIVPLSSFGVLLHIGKGELKNETIRHMASFGALYGVIPPVSALIRSCVRSTKLILFPELGMEAVYRIDVERLPVLVAAARGCSVYD